MTTPTLFTVDGLLADLRQLIECESPSADLGAVARSADLVASLGAKHLGVEPERITVDGVSHLRWRLGSRDRDTGGRVLVLCHHDTVHPLGTLETMPYDVTDGVLRGPGCFDMLAGLVMAFHAVAALASTDGVTLLVTGDEELGSISSRALIEETAQESSAVLVLEASADGGALKTARKGASMYDVVVTGRAAHAGLEPEKGVNATIEISQQVLAIASLGDPAAGTSVTPTVISAGTTTNTVPGSAVLSVDVRAWTTAEQERVDTAIRALTPALPGATLEIRGGINRPPLEQELAAPLYTRALTVAEKLGLPPLAHAQVGGASDGNFTAGLGIPTLDGLGAVGGGAHTTSEHLYVDRLVDRTQLLHGLIQDLLKEPACL
ncbi:M20 family metallopeptidase [Nocardioides sp. Kera G14]|uniref:M20 family metallopeptidase n=1 Tax=Nocardioides sp. Kera G14 TaxID=2884264 RepID=UPI001D11C526|nr:M20 family metallopeptidase [Nocardioides sp. Kera G14]UDY23825.1 M20 family metallopeptidase [Nocardioides sp. Kera G14]